MFNRLIARLGGTVMGAAMRAQEIPTSQNHGSRHPVHLRTSEKGLRFIYTGETQPGVSNVLHWPTGENSGVTLGPGYDMGGRTKTKIIEDLMAVGVPRADAAKAAEAAGLKGALAAKFVKDNPGLVRLTPIDEYALLEHIVPEYEGRVRRALHIDLFQHQFDALVSFAYNPGGRFSRVASLINSGEVTAALLWLKGATTSKGVKMKSLVHRRGREAALYLYAEYGVLRSVG